MDGKNVKSNCPLSLITSCVTLGSNCNQLPVLTCNKSIASLRKNFGPHGSKNLVSCDKSLRKALTKPSKV